MIEIADTDLSGNDRMMLLSTFIDSTQSNYAEGGNFPFEISMRTILNILMHKYSATILFALHEIKFSSEWELSKLCGISALYEINKQVANLEKFGLVKQLRKDHEDYQVIKEFWKKEHPTSSKFPKMLFMNPAFMEAFEAFQLKIRKSYVYKSTLVEIMKRGQRYEKFYENESESIFSELNLERTKIGNCIECMKPIRSDSTKGKEYHEFPAGIVCDRCKRTATISKRREWIHSNK